MFELTDGDGDLPRYSGCRMSLLCQVFDHVADPDDDNARVAEGGVAIQGEDEIASIGMCIGAAMTGARALTATSGPGLSRYSESIGLAIMGEVPLVIVDVQRLGLATRGATTVEQGDVQFAPWGTAGSYPLIVLAPSSIPECYSLTRPRVRARRPLPLPGAPPHGQGAESHGQ